MIVVGNWPGRIRVGLNGHFGIPPSQIASAGPEPSPLLNDVDGGDENTEFAWVIRSLPGSGVLVADDFGGAALVGAADGVYVIPYGLYTAPSGAGSAWNGDTSFSVSIGAMAAVITGTVPVTGQASASVEVTGQASGSITVSGAAAASVEVTGQASGSITISGAAAASVEVTGQASGSITVSGAAAASVEVTGQASGSITISGAAAASVGVLGQVAGLVEITGAATAAAGILAQTYGTIDIGGSAYAAVDGGPPGEILATMVGTVSLSGVAQASVGVSATVAGLVSLSGKAYAGTFDATAANLRKSLPVSPKAQTIVVVSSPGSSYVEL